MNKYFQGKYRIGSARLEGYDYSRPGKYFVTICTGNRECFFGNVINDEMYFSVTGVIANSLWQEIPDHFNNVKLDAFVIMPNHVHGIVVIENNNGIVGRNANKTKTGGITGMHNPMLSNNSLSKIIRWYKGRCTFEINKTIGPNHFSWQPRFHDHIIRNNNGELNRIRRYIRNNQKNWETDEKNLLTKETEIHLNN